MSHLIEMGLADENDIGSRQSVEEISERNFRTCGTRKDTQPLTQIRVVRVLV